ncbi:MAF protein [Bernardetia litoralis DSM 6794]|uniref:dTTP/UTP pyrophosphatase n=1 Tax=Bernardetia litoralis (strain ATCC 23117 / DSM 6794 / NBRC 15988 / NCIMB 1366 / Fx l1 / Sio-4) TaxID=880071 RepID=I4AKV7_BERLS|nr:Maf family nucleotide pyrophosphatase [Bernardetia litoralis]AFM04592.1 MAF protein [Bernardetia litoralis DSM 6794]
MLLNHLLQHYKVILGSQSPRRKQLLSSMDIEFEQRVKDVNEDILPIWETKEVAQKLAERKALAQQQELKENDTDFLNEILITSDTIVVIEDKILNKPQNIIEAREMLRLLSGKKHLVITGVCICTKSKLYSFLDETEVFFKELSQNEIDYYIQKYKPFDKAGSYGAQEWLGMIGVERINGSYFNVMGLPVQKLYEEWVNFLT